MIKVGIFGATGYTGYELIQCLKVHPNAEVAFATSRSHAGHTLNELYPCPDKVPLISPEEANLDSIDVAFCCLPHGTSMHTVKQLRKANVRTIDLSGDFRLQDVEVYEHWYRVEHIAPELIADAAYGLTEIYRDQIAKATLIANPGCYPTSALLALYPLVKNGHLSTSQIIVDAKSGASGAGRKLSLRTQFCETDENLVPYSIGRSHRHLAEIEQEIEIWGNQKIQVTFTPHLLPVKRGILSTIYITLTPGWSVSSLVDLYQTAYADDPFIHILPAGQLPSLTYVQYTNRCALGFAQASETSFILVSAIDNLLKGASGQAVQNMNLMFGLDERLGLRA